MAPTDIVVDLVIRYGLQVLGAMVILAVGPIVAEWTGALTDRSVQKRGIEPPVRKLVVRVVRAIEGVRELGVRPRLPRGEVRLVAGGSAVGR